MLRFLLNRRWLSLLGFVVVFAILCGLLARWQWHRREGRLASNAQIVSNYDRPAEGLDSVLPQGQSYPANATWRQVRLRGQYLSEASLLVRNRPYDFENNSFYSATGFNQVVPFLDTASGRVLLINRGWLPTGEQAGRPDEIPAPPSGIVTVIVRLQPQENRPPDPTPNGQIYWIRPADLADTLSDRSNGQIRPSALVGDAYGQLAGESPAPSTAPRTFPKPLLDEGPHLSYTIQWVLFALIAFVGFALLARRSWEDELADQRQTGATHPRGRRAAPARRHPERVSDEEFEDALLDARNSRNG